MLLFIKIKCENNEIAREVRRKFLARGGDKSAHGGGSQKFFYGGGLPLHGGDPPSPPPYWAALTCFR